MRNPITLFTAFRLIAISFLLFSCSNEPDIVNFLVNGENPIASDTAPTEESDWLKVFTEIPIIFKDVSTPANKIGSRVWYIDGKAQDKDAESLYHTFEEAGDYEVKLCVNEEYCTSKWLRVQSLDPEPVVLAPTISLISPSSIYESTTSSSINLEALIQNVESDAQIQLLLNGKAQDFAFDAASGTLTKKIRLRKGDNEVEVVAEVDGEIASKLINVSRLVPIDDDDDDDDDEIKPINITFLEPTKDIASTDKKKQKLYLKTENLPSKNALKILLNDQPIKDFKFDKQKAAWAVEVDLQKGKNVITASAGKQKVSRSINYINLGTLGTGGPAYSDYDPVCIDNIGDTYRFSLKPKQPMELLSFILNTTQCGGITVEISSAQGKESMRKILVRGKNQVDFEIGGILEAGITYTITCTTYAGHPSCSATVAPGLIDATTCNIKTPDNAAFTLDSKGKTIIFELKYLY